MTDKIAKEKANIILEMEQQLENELLKEEPEKLWNESFIKYQIEKRKKGTTFAIEDHIRAMVYSMLSSGVSWDRIARDTDSETKCIRSVDEVFYHYDTEQLLKCTPEQLRDAIMNIHCGTQSTLKQMEALLSVNIPKLLKLKEEYEIIDNYYQKFIKKDNSLKTLITALSNLESKDKMEQMDIALVCEYLRNVGYDIPKPDRHICRILGGKYLAFSEKEKVPQYEAFDIVVKLAELTRKCSAEVDYILWSYCATGYGEVCTVKEPRCNVCKMVKYCEKCGERRGKI